MKLIPKMRFTDSELDLPVANAIDCLFFKERKESLARSMSYMETMAYAQQPPAEHAEHGNYRTEIGPTIMFIVSKLLNVYYMERLTSEGFRKKVFLKALRRKLRHSQKGIIILRNLNESMAEHPDWHDEFKSFAGIDDYQKAFWESDLGYLLYSGNEVAENAYFRLAVDEIEKNCGMRLGEVL